MRPLVRLALEIAMRRGELFGMAACRSASTNDISANDDERHCPHGVNVFVSI